MTETQPHYGLPSKEQTEIQVSEYRKRSGCVGHETVSAEQKILMRMIKLLAAIAEFERRYHNNIINSQTNAFSLAFPEMKRRDIHRADIAKRAALRCKETYNNLVLELSTL